MRASAAATLCSQLRDGVRLLPCSADIDELVTHNLLRSQAGGHRAGAHWELRDFLHIPNLFSHTGESARPGRLGGRLHRLF